MTVRFLRAWNGHSEGDIAELGGTEESRLIALGIAQNPVSVASPTSYKKDDVITKLKTAMSNGESTSLEVMSSPPAIVDQGNVNPDQWPTIPLGVNNTGSYYYAAKTNSADNPGINPALNIPNPGYAMGITGVATSWDTANFISCAGVHTGGVSAYFSSSLIVRFCTDAPLFGLFINTPGVAGNLVLVCDGKLVSASPITTGVGKRTISINFGTRKQRDFTLYVQTGLFGGIVTSQIDMVSPGNNNSQLFIAGDGDSYMGIRGANARAAIVGTICQKLNADFFIGGIGGTGFVITNGYTNAIQRISLMTGANEGKTNVIVISLGINDTAGTTFNDAVLAYFAALRSALPDTLFIVTTSWITTDANISSYTSGKTAPIFSAVRSSGGKYILVDNINGTFETSWGTSGSIGGAWQTGYVPTGLITSMARTANVSVITMDRAHGLATGIVGLYNAGTFTGTFYATTTSTTITLSGNNGSNETYATPELASIGRVVSNGAGGYLPANSINYGSGDGTHYNSAGADYLSNRLWEAIKIAVATYQ
jgi:lysophospholipase L1-like esterase